jgi:hypothetical protein
MNILQYLENIKCPLYPTQQFVMKMIYGIPLSDEPSIKIEHPLKHMKATFSEKSYLRYLYKEGRSNVVEQGAEPKIVSVTVGRRAGKDFTLALCIAYTANVCLRPQPFMLKPELALPLVVMQGYSLLPMADGRQ